MEIKVKAFEWTHLRLLVTGCLLSIAFQLVTLNSSAQYVKLLDFGSPVNGYGPRSTLVSDGTYLYGTTSSGGLSDYGTIFKIMPDGTGYTRLLAFDGVTNGRDPFGALFYDGTFLYGMTSLGGIYGYGTIFKIMPDGTGYTTLLNFDSDVTGGNPNGSLISDGTFLYGMTALGGLNNDGTIFRIMPNGSGFQKLLDFDDVVTGRRPDGSLISVGTFLYGMTGGGGANGYGTIFRIMPNGSGFAKLLDFTGTANGSNPNGSLISDGTFLYGMTYDGGANGEGTIFKIMPDGTGYVKLFDFAGPTSGSNPQGTLISDGTFLYGTTGRGGTNDEGTIFKIMPNGSGYVKLLDFAGITNGSTPRGSLISVGPFLYGMTERGGTSNGGAIFKIMPNGTGYSKVLDFVGAPIGASPRGDLISDGSFLYGMTEDGGTNGFGTIFKIMQDGNGYTKLLDFDGAILGRGPLGSLSSDGTFLYGMARIGGTTNEGTIFKIMPDGTGFVKLLDFAGATTGSYPQGTLISDGTFLYGTTSGGGTNGLGTLFKIMPNGSGFAKLLDFTGTATGSFPTGSLISDGTFLYGMTSQGGTNGFGTIFKIMPNGTGYTKLLDFAGTANGRQPQGSLISDGTFLYGMTSQGGTSNVGTIFKILPDGSGYVKLLDFGGVTFGSNPYGSLLSVGPFLYGMTRDGGTVNGGVIFKIMPDGTGYAKLMDFDQPSSAFYPTGYYPFGSLISVGTFLYGMTRSGGPPSVGTVFKYSIAPTPTITNFAPLSGVVGTTVTVTGISFSAIPANNIVRFGATRATVSAATTTQLTVTVPAGATFEPISVTVGGLTAYALKPFIPTFAGGTPIDATSFGAHIDFTTPAAARSVNIADLDLDGLADMVVSSQLGTTGIISVFRNTSTPGAISAGSFAAPFNFTETDKERAGMAIADIDGDGKPEIIAVDVINDRVHIYRNLSYPGTLNASTFDSPNGFNVGIGDSPKNVHVEDLDGDGKPEIVTADFDQDRISIIKNKSTFGSILFEPRIYIPVGNGATDIAIRDFNNDGKPDLAIANQFGNTVSVLENIATPGVIAVASFENAVNFAVGSLPTKIAIGDIDGDGKQDLVTANLGSNNISILRNQITGGAINPGSFASSTNFTTGGPTTSVELGDLNGDGKIDIATAINTGVTGVVVLQNSSTPGNLILDPFVGFSADAATFEVAIGDIDGDGRPDIATANNTGQSASILQGSNSSAGTLTITLQPTDATVCVGTMATFTTAATGTTNITFQWQFSPDGIVPFTDITNGSGYSNVTTATLSVNTTGSFGVGRYRCRINGDLATEAITNNSGLFINTLPTAPTTTGASACGTSTVILTAAGSINGNYRWYTTSSGGAALSGEVNAAYTTPSLSVTTAYYVSIHNGTCESATRTPATATINSLPSAPTTTGASSCLMAALSLTASGGVNGQYRWYTVPIGGTALAGEFNDTYLTPLLSVTTTYHVSIHDGTCESLRSPVVAAINSESKPTVVTSNCTATAATLTGPAGFTTYAWSNGAMTQQIIVTTAGSYTLVVTASTGCSSPPSDPTVFTSTFCNQAPAITPTTVTTIVQGTVTIDLTTLTSDLDNNIDLATLQIIAQPTSGAAATIDASFNLFVDYAAVEFAGTDHLTIQVCDVAGACTQEVITIEVAGDIIIFNAISPNGDGKNDAFIIEYINVLPDTKENKVTIFNRWGDTVFNVDNYDNQSRAFRGLNNNGNELPTGTYYYRIDFPNGAPSKTGFLSLRK